MLKYNFLLPTTTLLIDELYPAGSLTRMSARVCIICGCLLHGDDGERIGSRLLKETSHMLHTKGHDMVTNNIIVHLHDLFRGRRGDLREEKPQSLASDECGPRMIEQKEPSFNCCLECKACIEDGQMPLYSSASRRVCGGIPDPFLVLNSNEWNVLIYIEATRCKGYNQDAKEYETVTAADVSDGKPGVTAVTDSTTKSGYLGPIERVVNFLKDRTKHEEKRARYQVRIDVIMSAVEWLIKNNIYWLNADITEVEEELQEILPITGSKHAALYEPRTA